MRDRSNALRQMGRAIHEREQERIVEPRSVKDAVEEKYKSGGRQWVGG